MSTEHKESQTIEDTESQSMEEEEEDEEVQLSMWRIQKRIEELDQLSLWKINNRIDTLTEKLQQFIVSNNKNVDDLENQLADYAQVETQQIRELQRRHHTTMMISVCLPFVWIICSIMDEILNGKQEFKNPITGAGMLAMGVIGLMMW